MPNFEGYQSQGSRLKHTSGYRNAFRAVYDIVESMPIRDAIFTAEQYAVVLKAEPNTEIPYVVEISDHLSRRLGINWIDRIGSSIVSQTASRMLPYDVYQAAKEVRRANPLGELRNVIDFDQDIITQYNSFAERANYYVNNRNILPGENQVDTWGVFNLDAVLFSRLASEKTLVGEGEFFERAVVPELFIGNSDESYKFSEVTAYTDPDQAKWYNLPDISSYLPGDIIVGTRGAGNYCFIKTGEDTCVHISRIKSSNATISSSQVYELLDLQSSPKRIMILQGERQMRVVSRDRVPLRKLE